jgi:hypothetical protein
MTIYPLPMRFPVTKPPVEDDYVDVQIDRAGWAFMTRSGRERFLSLPMADRLELRKAFEAQVALAKQTPKDPDEGPEALKAMFR